MALKEIISRKILFIAPQPFFANRGTPLNVRAVVSRLADLGYDVHLLVFPFGEKIALSGVTIHRCLRPWFIRSVPIGFSWRKFFCDASLFLAAVWLSLSDDFVLFHGVEEASVIAGFLGLVSGKPYVVDMDSCIPEQLEQDRLSRVPFFLKAVTAIENFFLRRAAAVVTVCRNLTSRTAEIAPKARIFQIEDFPLEGGLPGHPKVVADVSALVASPETPIVLYTGNLEIYQGIDLLLESFAAVLTSASFRSVAPERRPVLLIVGGEEDAVRAYKAQTRSRGLEKSVHFLGARPTDEMASFLALADTLVSPRLTGGNTPLKIYSYMDSGKPIVATKIVSHEQVLNSENAFLAEPHSTSFAAALVRALCASPLDRARITNRAKDLVRTKYSKDAFDVRIRQLYDFLFWDDLGEESSLAEPELRVANARGNSSANDQ